MDRLKSPLVSIALCALLGVGACARSAPPDRAMARAVAPIPTAPQTGCSEGDWTKAESYQESKSLAKQLNNNADEEERRHLRELAAVTGDGLGAKIQRHLLEQPDTEWRAEGLVENENAHVVWNDINPACREILSQ
jgi:hypothetical protein